MHTGATVMTMRLCSFTDVNGPWSQAYTRLLLVTLHPITCLAVGVRVSCKTSAVLTVLADSWLGLSRFVSLCFAARLNLPIKWLPDRIAEQNFNLEEPPTKASAWVGVLLNNHLKVFRERLSTMPMLSPSDVDQVWLSLLSW